MRKYIQKFSISIFSKIYNLRYFIVGNVARKSRCFFGEKIQISKGGGNKYPFSTKIQTPGFHLMIFLKNSLARLERPKTGCWDPKPNQSIHQYKPPSEIRRIFTQNLIFLQPKYEKNPYLPLSQLIRTQIDFRIAGKFFLNLQ